MSNFPKQGSSQPRVYTAGFITEKGLENLPLDSPKNFSQHKPQYALGKKMPMTPTPSHSSSTETDHGTATVAVAETVGLASEKPDVDSPTGLAHQPEERCSQSRLVALYHKFNPQMTFENRGSTARDHLSSERTFLAYVRTSLALASTGVALVQLFTITDFTSETAAGEASKRVQIFARPLGVSTVVMALIMLCIAVYRYFLIQNNLPGNIFPVARISVIFTTFVLSAIVVVIFAALLAGR